MNIPVFHDDQHGTAIIAGAALVNGLEVAGKDIGAVRLVINGAGAAAVACARHFIRLGVSPELILMCDSKGVIYEGRTEGMNVYKAQFARSTAARTLADALKDADVFVGLSGANCVSKEMVKSMGRSPLVLALSNPDPEIPYADAIEARPDAIVATGRSDYPNQVNNVLGFPAIFRGALDCRATRVTEEMMMAATRSLAELAKEDVPDSVRRIYGSGVWPAVSDSEAVRPAGRAAGGAGGGEGGDGVRRGTAAAGPGGVRAVSGGTAGTGRGRDDAAAAEGAAPAGADGVPGGRQRDGAAGVPDAD
jgi:malate dehydrogenase (oxaloacetate-decarboxylating)(NADP+)